MCSGMSTVVVVSFSRMYLTCDHEIEVLPPIMPSTSFILVLFLLSGVLESLSYTYWLSPQLDYKQAAITKTKVCVSQCFQGHYVVKEDPVWSKFRSYWKRQSLLSSGKKWRFQIKRPSVVEMQPWTNMHYKSYNNKLEVNYFRLNLFWIYRTLLLLSTQMLLDITAAPLAHGL